MKGIVRGKRDVERVRGVWRIFLPGFLSKRGDVRRKKRSTVGRGLGGG